MALVQFFSALLALLLWLTPIPSVTAAGTVLSIDISKGGLNPMPIALPLYAEMGSDDQPGAPGEFSQKVVDVVTADLERSGLFRPLDRKSYLQEPVALWRTGPNYRDWRLLNAEALVRGAIRKSGGKLIADIFVHDVFQSSEVGSGRRFSVNSTGEWRYLAHRIADEIYTRLTGETGYFTSRIAMVAERGKQKWLIVMDQDGANPTDLNKGQTLTLTPRFSPNGDNLFYLSYESGEPRIYRWELYTGRKMQVVNFPGLNSTPSWSPDGSTMALTLSKDGNPEIYRLNLASNALSRLTNNPGIDTSPSWSPDGKRIAFNSNRGGTPQIYVMDADGSNVQRITHEGNYNAAPAWSPRGDLIAYVKGGEGRFRIAVIDPAGKRSRVLTDSWMDESPSWSPNGRVILFSRQNGDATKLYTVDLTGYNERPVQMPEGVSGSDPSWSGLIR